MQELPEVSFSKKEAELVSKPLFSKIATIGKDGTPQITPTWFTFENGKFIVVTPEKSVKIRNLRRDPRVSILVDDGYKYVAIKGRAKINTSRNVERDTERQVVRYLGKEKAKEMTAEILKVKHIAVEITPEKVFSQF
jgi:PPOX class probable F420-dependent enzyme